MAQVRRNGGGGGSRDDVGLPGFGPTFGPESVEQAAAEVGSAQETWHDEASPLGLTPQCTYAKSGVFEGATECVSFVEGHVVAEFEGSIVTAPQRSREICPIGDFDDDNPAWVEVMSHESKGRHGPREVLQDVGHGDHIEGFTEHETGNGNIDFIDMVALSRDTGEVGSAFDALGSKPQRLKHIQECTIVTADIEGFAMNEGRQQSPVEQPIVERDRPSFAL